MVEMYTYRVDRAIFLWNLSASFSRVKIFPSFNNFPDAHAILVVTLAAYTLRMDTPNRKSFIPHMQITRHFHWRSSVLFTLGKRCTSSYDSDLSYITCQRDLPGEYSTICHRTRNQTKPYFFHILSVFKCWDFLVRKHENGWCCTWIIMCLQKKKMWNKKLICPQRKKPN